jgi:hypothetical protein
MCAPSGDQAGADSSRGASPTDRDRLTLTAPEPSARETKICVSPSRPSRTSTRRDPSGDSSPESGSTVSRRGGPGRDAEIVLTTRWSGHRWPRTWIVSGVGQRRPGVLSLSVASCAGRRPSASMTTTAEPASGSRTFDVETASCEPSGDHTTKLAPHRLPRVSRRRPLPSASTV